MKLNPIFFCLLFFSLSVKSQSIDTIKFVSEVFNKERTIYIHKPLFYKYQAKEVNIPIVFILDGQHEWFYNPILQTIKALEFTKQVPNVLTVIIPLDNRNKECRITDINEILPLDNFIIKEVSKIVNNYSKSNERLIIGHSASASFALTSYLNNLNFYTGVFAHSPFEKVSELIHKAEQLDSLHKLNIFYSVGGSGKSLDSYHRNVYEKVKATYPAYFSRINTFESDYSRHNSIPIISSPIFFEQYYAELMNRFGTLAEVLEFDKLKNPPQSVQLEVEKFKEAFTYNGSIVYPTIPDINGLASRYSNNGYNKHAIAILEIGTKIYPHFYGFPLSLYEFNEKDNPKIARIYLEKAYDLLIKFELDNKENRTIIKEIDQILNKKY